MNHTPNRREIGGRYERLTADHLESRGHQILAQNWRCRYGEIDLITIDHRTLVFIEVKARHACTRGSFDPLAGVDRKKQDRLRRLAEIYLSLNERRLRAYQLRSVRFDVVGIRFGEEVEIEHFPDAFR